MQSEAAPLSALTLPHEATRFAKPLRPCEEI